MQIIDISTTHSISKNQWRYHKKPTQMTPSKVFFSYTDTFEFSKLSIKNNKFFKTLCLPIVSRREKNNDPSHWKTIAATEFYCWQYKGQETCETAAKGIRVFWNLFLNSMKHEMCIKQLWQERSAFYYFFSDQYKRQWLWKLTVNKDSF